MKSLGLFHTTESLGLVTPQQRGWKRKSFTGCPAMEALTNYYGGCMKKVFKILSVALLLAVWAIPAAEAVTIEYTAENVSENRWLYDFTIFNDSEFAIYAFDIDFGVNVGELELINVASGWDGFVSEPFELFDDWWFGGVLAAWADENVPLLQAADLGVFSVALNWYGNGPSLGFIAYDADFIELEGFEYAFVPGSGSEPAIPEPGTLTLLGTGFVGLIAYYRIRKAGKR